MNKMVMTNLNGDVIICTPEQAVEIETKQAWDILNNGFETTEYQKESVNGTKVLF